MKYAPKDYTGQERGRLKAIKALYATPRGWFWLFECKCGKTVERLAHRIFEKHAKVRSCGCQRSESAKRLNFSGKRSSFKKGHANVGRWITQLRLPNGTFAPPGYVQRRIITCKDE